MGQFIQIVLLFWYGYQLSEANYFQHNSLIVVVYCTILDDVAW